MTKTIQPGARCGFVQAIPSKSMAHRQLICAALSDTAVSFENRSDAEDVQATLRCLCALGLCTAQKQEKGLRILPALQHGDECCTLYCGESGTTLRFLLPIVAAMGKKAAFHTEGRLAQRPHTALLEALSEHGVRVTAEGSMLTCQGRLTPGVFRIPGNISSQYLSGLLLALPLLDGDSLIEVEGVLESAPYAAMTKQVLQTAGIRVEHTPTGYRVPGRQRYNLPGTQAIEGDWSAAAVFLCMGAMSKNGIVVQGLREDTMQGDRAILDILKAFGASVTHSEAGIAVCRGKLHGQTVDASQIPDLIPAVCALAAAAEGTTEIIHAQRLRYKESDRLHATAQMLRALGGCVEEHPDGLRIHGAARLQGGSVDSFGDHRIAMAAAAAACVCRESVTVQQSACTAKSYPRFWEVYETLEVEP